MAGRMEPLGFPVAVIPVGTLEPLGYPIAVHAAINSDQPLGKEATLAAIPVETEAADRRPLEPAVDVIGYPEAVQPEGSPEALGYPVALH